MALLAATAAVRAEEASVVVPSAAAPTLDARAAPNEWDAAASFDVSRGEDVFATGRFLRSGRDLFLFFEGRLPPGGIGVRITFVDRVSLVRHFLDVTPLDPPRSPLLVFRQAKDRAPEPVDAALCDIRFLLEPGKPFSFEARVPLDLLEFGRRAEEYDFSIEIQDRQRRKTIALFPGNPRLLTGARAAGLKPASDWGAGVRADADPERQPALDLLDRIAREQVEAAPGSEVMAAYLGWGDGRRNAGRLEALDTGLAALCARYPDYPTLRTHRITTLTALGRFKDAIEVLDGIARDFPVLASIPRHHLVHVEMLRSDGRFDAAHEYLSARRDSFRGDAAVARELKILAHLREAARQEKAYREQERDLPRVRLETARGPIVLELFEDDAPNAVKNFVSLTERRFFDGTRFHWVEGGRRVIGGDPNSKDEDPHNDGFGSPGYYLESEPGRRSHLPFTVSLVDERRTPRTESCTFSIQISPFPDIDGRHTVIGRVVEGFDAVRRLDYYDRIDRMRVVSKRAHPYEPIRR